MQAEGQEVEALDIDSSKHFMDEGWRGDSVTKTFSGVNHNIISRKSVLLNEPIMKEKRLLSSLR